LGTSLGATLDTRRPRQLDDPKPGSDFVSPPGSGAELQLRAAHYASLRAVTERQSAPQRYQWVSYGATAAGFVDLTGEQRVVGLHVLADFTDPVQRDGVVPFDRQVSLGGPRPLRGFLEGRLRDRSATVALLDYRWPVWVWLDGTMHYAIGNVFGQHLDGFDLGAMRSSYGVGIQSNRTGDTPFQMLLALGTRTFDEGAGIDSVRLAIGSSHGF
jgi:outer membrane protein assembly factor BamA